MISKYKSQLMILLGLISVNQCWSATVTTVTSGFNGSGDLLVTANGDIYNANFGPRLNNASGNSIVRITPDGSVSTFATGFQGASGMTLDSAGNILQASINGGTISRVSPNGTVTVIASQGFNGPVGVAVDSSDRIYVANCRNNTISRIENGVGVTFSSSTLFQCPNGLTTDDQNNLYAVNFNNGSVIKIDPSGNASLLANSGGGNGHIVFGNNKLYFANHVLRQVFELTLEGDLSVIAGSGSSGHEDGDALSSTFTALNGIGISPDGKILYVNEPVAVGPAGAVNLNPNVLRAIELNNDSNDFEINPGLIGSWFDSRFSGQGVVLDFALSENRFDAVLYWFTYNDVAADPDTELSGLGSTQSRWFTAIGPVNDSPIIEMTLFRSSGGIFNDPQAVDTVEVGTVEVEFFSCFDAIMNFQFNEPELLSGSFELQRITPDINCELLSE